MTLAVEALVARRARGGLAWYGFGSLERGADCVAAVSTRHGGVSDGELGSLNLSYRVGDEPDHVAENRRRLFDALQLDPARAVAAGQVHGARVAVLDQKNDQDRVDGVDGLVTAVRGLPLTLLYADCVPILAADPVRGVVGVGHAGWRGTVAGVAGALVAAFVAGFGSDPADLLVGIGPSIGGCCYEVGDEVVRAFAERGDDFGAFGRMVGGRWRVDLKGANRRQLRAAGVPDANLVVAPWCTACRVDEFYSHRAQSGRAGRFAAIVALK
jgi:YfiH family protein